ncbi:MAG: SMC family ATPase [Myxococcales bacterium]
MKPLLLVFQGLHSYRDEATVDFEKLGERGLFGIFGPTGAGKSTILDAITLALYGEVERVQGGKRQGIAHPEAEEIRVAFRFEAGAGVRYEVRRSFRAKDGLIDAKGARLDRLEDGGVAVPLADKTTTVDEAVEKVIGLKSENFRRVVVLPQGKFAEFLQLTGAKRRAMLETILGLERYGEALYRRVADRRREVQSRLDHDAGLLEALAHATQDAVEQARAARDAKKAAAAEADAALGSAAARLHEARAVFALQTEARRLEAKLVSLLAGTPAVEAQKAELDAAQRAEPLRALLAEVHKLAAEAAEAEARRRDAEAKEQAWAGDLESARSALQAASVALEADGPRLSARRDELKQAEKLEVEHAERIRDLQTAERARAKAMEALAQAESERARLETALAEADRQVTAIAAKISQTQVDPSLREQVQAAFRALVDHREAQRIARACLEKRERKQAAAARAHTEAQSAAQASALAASAAKEGLERAKAHREARPGDEKGLLEALKSANAIDNLVKAVCDAERDVALAREREAALTARAAKLEDDRKAAAGACEKALEKAEAARLAFEEIAQRGAAARLSCRLVDGKACPVCGSTAHPVPAQEAAPGELEAARRAHDTARKAGENAQRALAEVEADLKSVRGSRQEAEEVCRQAMQTLALRRSKLPEARRTEVAQALEAWRITEREAMARAEESFHAWQVRLQQVEKEAGALGEAANEASKRALETATAASAEERAAAEAGHEVDEARASVEARRAVLEERRGGLAVEAIEAEQEALSRREREAAQLSVARQAVDERRRESEEALRARVEESARLGAELEGLGRRAKEAQPGAGEPARAAPGADGWRERRGATRSLRALARGARADPRQRPPDAAAPAGGPSTGEGGPGGAEGPRRGVRRAGPKGRRSAAPRAGEPALRRRRRCQGRAARAGSPRRALGGGARPRGRPARERRRPGRRSRAAGGAQRSRVGGSRSWSRATRARRRGRGRSTRSWASSMRSCRRRLPTAHGARRSRRITGGCCLSSSGWPRWPTWSRAASWWSSWPSRRSRPSPPRPRSGCARSPTAAMSWCPTRTTSAGRPGSRSATTTMVAWNARWARSLAARRSWPRWRWRWRCRCRSSSGESSSGSSSSTRASGRSMRSRSTWRWGRSSACRPRTSPWASSRTSTTCAPACPGGWWSLRHGRVGRGAGCGFEEG